MLVSSTVRLEEKCAKYNDFFLLGIKHHSIQILLPSTLAPNHSSAIDHKQRHGMLLCDVAVVLRGDGTVLNIKLTTRTPTTC